MYDPEASFAANAEFDQIIGRVNLFIDRTLPLLGKDAEVFGQKLKQCIELLRRKYDDYLNEFDPVKKEQLHVHWQEKAAELAQIMKTMVENEWQN